MRSRKVSSCSAANDRVPNCTVTKKIKVKTGHSLPGKFILIDGCESYAKSVFQTVARFENPGDQSQEEQEENADHAQAQADTHVAFFVKAPAKAADQVDDRIGKRNFLPQRRQHLDRIKTST